MSLDPWIIERLQEQQRERRERDEARRSRIELPQTRPMGDAPIEADLDDDVSEGSSAGATPPRRVEILEISPAPENTFDL